MERFHALQSEVWAISIDPPDKLQELRSSLGLTYLNLMDSGSKTIKRYGILNEGQGEIPHPTAVIVDRQGIIRFLRVDEDYKKRPSNEELLEALRRLETTDTSRMGT